MWFRATSAARPRREASADRPTSGNGGVEPAGRPGGLPRAAACLDDRCATTGRRSRSSLRQPPPLARPGRSTRGRRASRRADFGARGRERDAAVGRRELDDGRAGPHRLAVRAAPGRGDARRPTGLHPFPRRGPSTAGGPGRRPRRALARLDDTTDLHPALPDGLTLPEAGEARRCAAGGAYVDGDLAAYDAERDQPRPDVAPRTCRVHLKWGEIHPRTMLADLAGRRRRRRDVPQGAGLAGVLRRRAVPAPETARDYLRPEFARMAYDEPGPQLDGLAARAHRLPVVDAGMRQLRATGWMHNRVADDRGQLPGQGPARRVAARRPALHALAGRRRPGLQPARLAVDGRLRHRRGAVLPGLQPDHARAASSTRDGAYVRTPWVPRLLRRRGPATRTTTRASVGYPGPIVGPRRGARREALDLGEGSGHRPSCSCPAPRCGPATPAATAAGRGSAAPRWCRRREPDVAALVDRAVLAPRRVGRRRLQAATAGHRATAVPGDSSLRHHRLGRCEGLTDRARRPGRRAGDRRRDAVAAGGAGLRGRSRPRRGRRAEGRLRATRRGRGEP